MVGAIARHDGGCATTIRSSRFRSGLFPFFSSKKIFRFRSGSHEFRTVPVRGTIRQPDPPLVASNSIAFPVVNGRSASGAPGRYP
jgi:hypothetical protein